jgi:uncharacterized membrane protein
MKRDANLSVLDRSVRVTVGVALAGAGVFLVSGAFGILLDVVGATLVLSGFIGFCHVYQACGISTAKKR